MAAGRRVECRADPLFTALRTYNSTADRPIYTRPSARYLYMRFFFFLIFLAFLPLRRYVRTFCNSTTHYCLPVTSIRRQQQQQIAIVPLSSRVVRFSAVAIPLFSLVSDITITLLSYRLVYYCCCFCCVFWYLCVPTQRTRNRKSYDLLVRTTHIPRSSGWKKMHFNFRFL